MSVHYFSYEDQQITGRKFPVQYYSKHIAGGNDGGEEKKTLGGNGTRILQLYQRSSLSCLCDITNSHIKEEVLHMYFFNVQTITCLEGGKFT